MWIIGSHRREYARKVEEEGTIVAYPSPERAARAMAALYDYHHKIKNAPEQPGQTFELQGFDQEKINNLIAGSIPGKAEILGLRALEIIAACGMPVVQAKTACDKEQAVKNAVEIGFPVPEILELDINPVIATPEGLLALDARLTVSVQE